MKLFWSDALSVFSAILDSTFDRWHDSAHAWDQKNNMADFMGDEAKKIQYFPDGSLLNTMIISIIDSEKRYTDILKEPYTVYLIETKWVFVFRGCIKVWTCQVSPLKIDLSALFWSFDALILICYDLLEALCGPKYIVVGNPKTSRIWTDRFFKILLVRQPKVLQISVNSVKSLFMWLNTNFGEPGTRISGFMM